MKINAMELCRLKLDAAKSEVSAFDPDDYYWVISDDVRREITLEYGRPYDPITGGEMKLLTLLGIKVKAYDHIHLGVLELKRVQTPYYITTASRPSDDWVMKMLKDNLNMQYGLQPGRGGFTYFKPKFEIHDHEPEETSLYPETMNAFTILPRCGKSLATLQARLAAVDLIMDGASRRYKAPEIDRVIYNNPATIVFWKDGTKTVVKAQDEAFDEEKGLAMAIAKKVYGNDGKYFNKIKKHLPKIEEKAVKPKDERKK